MAAAEAAEQLLPAELLLVQMVQRLAEVAVEEDAAAVVVRRLPVRMAPRPLAEAEAEEAEVAEQQRIRWRHASRKWTSEELMFKC